ncbi:MAG: hypothetical protein V3T48_07890 [Vicinamibacterales bacterium]
MWQRVVSAGGACRRSSAETEARYVELTEEDYKQMVQDRRRAATNNNDQ